VAVFVDLRAATCAKKTSWQRAELSKSFPTTPGATATINMHMPEFKHHAAILAIRNWGVKKRLATKPRVCISML
jgi:hypothetical protein